MNVFATYIDFVLLNDTFILCQSFYLDLYLHRSLKEL